jgi:hypothetical protein
MGDPSFESRGSESETVLQGNPLVDSHTIMEQEAVRQTVDVAGFREEQSASVGGGVGIGVVEVAVAHSPLGASCLLEEVRPFLN